jgi:hypothetical protein
MVSLREKKTGVWALVSAAVVAAAVPLVIVLACGPDFEPEVFVPAQHPENPKQFAMGDLGVLQPGYARRDKIVAYRMLIGGHLSEAERDAYVNPPADAWETASGDQAQFQPVYRWRVARAEALKEDVKSTPEIEQTKSYKVKRDNFESYDSILNCTDDAFVAASAALRSRTKEWGAASADLTDWIKGQDAVFSNCSKTGTMPEPAPAGAGSLLKLDREYQIAAAKFYAQDYDGAITAFETIGRSTSSPWQPWGEYLAARAEVRKAAMTAAPSKNWGDQAVFDPALMEKARERLKTLVAVGNDRVSKAAAEEMQFIDVRLAPKKRLDEAAQALAGPKPDEEFAQDLADVLFLTGHNVTGDADLLRWIGQGGEVKAVSEWRTRKTQPWLVAALMEAKASDAGVADMEAAAAKIPQGAPAYVTVSYQRARLMIERGDYASARKLTTEVLGGLEKEQMLSTRNALLGERIKTATSFTEFLADAPRTVLDTASQAASLMTSANDIPKQQFDGDAAMAFNRQLPLARWVEAAKAKELPAHLRQAVAMAAWLRAQGLGDAATVKAAATMLPQPMRASGGDTGFATTLLLLRNPGLQPYLQQGVQRSASYRTLDSFRDNWWCQPWGDGPSSYDPVSAKPVTAKLSMSFLSADEKAAAADEATRLDALPHGVVWVGRRAIDYVKAHPDDKDAAEALAMVVRATRYGCYAGSDTEKAASEQKAVSKDAFTLLHKQYPKSPWTEKTPYFY